MMVERQLAKEGKKRREMGREKFIERVWEWRREYGGAILDQMKRLGASVDWGREYFTMDDHLSHAVREAFVRLYEEGLIYRGKVHRELVPRLRHRHLATSKSSTRTLRASCTRSDIRSLMEKPAAVKTNSLRWRPRVRRPCWATRPSP